jgi:hypothetical protein
MVAVNHARAQILAPHTDVDPWAGLDRSAGLGQDADAGVAPAGAILGGAVSPPAPPPPADGWDSGTPEPAARDPWGNPVVAAPAADPWASAPPAPVAAPTSGFPSVPPSRTGLLGRVHSTGGAIDLPRPVDDGPDGWREQD